MRNKKYPYSVEVQNFKPLNPLECLDAGKGLGAVNLGELGVRGYRVMMYHVNLYATPGEHAVPDVNEKGSDICHLCDDLDHVIGAVELPKIAPHDGKALEFGNGCEVVAVTRFIGR
jgi:hypothetical protein